MHNHMYGSISPWQNALLLEMAMKLYVIFLQWELVTSLQVVYQLPSKQILGCSRGASYSRSPSRYSYSGSDGMDRGSASPGPDRRKDRLKVKDKKDKKRKQKKEKKRKSKSREPVFEQPLPSQAPLMPFRESFLLPPKPMVKPCRYGSLLKLNCLPLS